MYKYKEIEVKRSQNESQSQGVYKKKWWMELSNIPTSEAHWVWRVTGRLRHRSSAHQTYLIQLPIIMLLFTFFRDEYEYIQGQLYENVFESMLWKRKENQS